MEQHQYLEISLRTILKVAAIGFALYILFLARNIMVWFFFALIISLLMDPAIVFLKRFRLPRIVSVAAVYIFVLGILGAMLYFTVPVFIIEINQLSKHIPGYLDRFNAVLKPLGFDPVSNVQDIALNLVSNLGEGSDSIFSALTTFFGGLYSSLFMFTLAFFISLEERGVEKVLYLLSPKKYEQQIVALFQRAQFKVSGWFGARILACIMVGLASFVIFFLLGIPYAFTLALFSGVLNFIPYIGPSITLVFVVVFVGVSNSWLVAIYILAALLVIQEIEAKILTPILMKKFIDLPPVLVLMSLLIGGVIFGFLGTIFAVPVFGIAYEFLKEFLEKRKQEELV